MIARKMKRLPKAARKSLTFDNGTEFRQHELLETVQGMNVYFCDPHSQWQGNHPLFQGI